MRWNEQMSWDFEGSNAFYAAVFGYEYGDTSGPFSYATFKVDGRDVGGIGGRHAGVPAGTQAGWRVYFGAADNDASVARVLADGGAVIREPIDHPSGRMGTVADDQGALFSLLGVTPGEYEVRGRLRLETCSPRRPFLSVRHGGGSGQWRGGVLDLHSGC